MDNVFCHPSKFSQNKTFQHYEKIGDSVINYVIVNLIFREFGPGDNLHDNLKQACVSNDSLAVTALLKDFQYKINCLEPLTGGMLADIYEAHIGERDNKLRRKFNQQNYTLLCKEVKKDVYDYKDTGKLNSVYNTYKNRANKHAEENKLGPLIPKVQKDNNSDVYYVTMQVGTTTFYGKNRNHKKANLICYISYLEDYNVSLK